MFGAIKQGARAGAQQVWRSCRPQVRRLSGTPPIPYAPNWLVFASSVATIVSSGVALGLAIDKYSPPQTLWDALEGLKTVAATVAYEEPLVPKASFTKCILTCMDPPPKKPSGAFVVWAPAASGKTSYLLTAARQWLATAGEKKKRRVLYISAYGNYEKLNDILKEKLFVNDVDELRKKLDDSDYELVIVLDQFDEACLLHPNAVEGFVVELATAARSAGTFRVLLAFQDPVRAKNALLWNGNQKIFLCGEFPDAPGDATTRILTDFKWTALEAEEFASDVSQHWSADTMALFKTAVCTSSTNATITALKHDTHLLTDENMQALVEVDGVKWEKGVAILKNRLVDV